MDEPSKFGEIVQAYREWLNQDPSPDPTIRRSQEHFKAHYKKPWNLRHEVYAEQGLKQNSPS